MEGFLGLLSAPFQWLASFSPPVALRYGIAIVALVLAGWIFKVNMKGVRLFHARGWVDIVGGLVVGIIFGVLTGVLWAVFNPIKVVPPYIHLRLFSMLTAVVGIIFGPVSGFLTGYIGTQVWAPLAGAYLPLHTPLADGVFVGLTGAIPAWLLRRGTLNDMWTLIQNNTRAWYLKTAIIGLGSGLFMSFFVALSLGALGALPFWVSFWAIGVVSDTGPLMLTGPIVAKLMQATRRTWSWIPQF